MYIDAFSRAFASWGRGDQFLTDQVTLSQPMMGGHYLIPTHEYTPPTRKVIRPSDGPKAWNINYIIKNW